MAKNKETSKNTAILQSVFAFIMNIICNTSQVKLIEIKFKIAVKIKKNYVFKFDINILIASF